MSDANQSPLEQVLRLCARQAPLPWYPRAFVRETGVSGEDLSVLIEHLLLDGLLERTPGTDATGPGLVLSQLGSESLNDPDALARLRKGLPLAEGDRGAIVREALSRIVRPYVSWALLAINILAFIYGILLASKNDAVQSFLTGLIPAADDQGRVNNFITLEQNGSLSAEAWLRGEWWRLHRAPAGSGVVRGKRGGPFLPLFARTRSVERDSPFIRVDLDRDARNR